MKAMLQVYYAPADDYRPVGKVFRLDRKDDHVLIFLHEESGTQKHFNFDAPGGIDAVIIPDLQKWGVDEVHHYNRADQLLFRIGLRELLIHGRRKKMGGRDRVFTHYTHWHMESGLPYKPPWCEEIVRYGGPMHNTKQLSLFGEPG